MSYRELELQKSSSVETAGNTTNNTPCDELARYAKEWLLHCEWQQRSTATVETRRVFLKNFLWFLNQRGYKECGLHELRQFFHYLASGHTEPGGRWGNPRLTQRLRPVSIKDYYNALRIFFEWMVREEILDVSPMARIEPPLVREEAKQPLELEEIQALVQAAKASNLSRRNVAIITMLFDSGVRASELVNLRVRDVDLDHGRFEVTGKGNKRRTCYLGEAARSALRPYLRKAKLSPDSPLFPAARGGTCGNKPLTRQGLLLLVKRLAKEAGISANTHQLRRTFATSMLEGGADICSVRDMLGHTNIQMTLKYLAVSQSHVEAQHRKFSPADRLNAKSKSR
ncbi:MAG TPA: tyrosine-type recombinase/integrase [Abditibacteriaceae bacterium]|jgi:site-specific recombinase XerD